MKFVRVDNQGEEEFYLVEDDCVYWSIVFHPSVFLGDQARSRGLLEYQRPDHERYLSQRVRPEDCEGLTEISYGCVFYELEAPDGRVPELRGKGVAQ
jgi:hypothetical protein